MARSSSKPPLPLVLPRSQAPSVPRSRSATFAKLEDPIQVANLTLAFKLVSLRDSEPYMVAFFPERSLTRNSETAVPILFQDDHDLDRIILAR